MYHQQIFIEPFYLTARIEAEKGEIEKAKKNLVVAFINAPALVVRASGDPIFAASPSLVREAADTARSGAYKRLMELRAELESDLLGEIRKTLSEEFPDSKTLSEFDSSYAALETLTPDRSLVDLAEILKFQAQVRDRYLSFARQAATAGRLKVGQLRTPPEKPKKVEPSTFKPASFSKATAGDNAFVFGLLGAIVGAVGLYLFALFVKGNGFSESIISLILGIPIYGIMGAIGGAITGVILGPIWTGLMAGRDRSAAQAKASEANLELERAYDADVAQMPSRRATADKLEALVERTEKLVSRYQSV